MGKGKNKMNNKNEKGFTLIELMIVVAIIGILAAIAIPQFSAYRIKAFNSSAVADARNASLQEEGMYTDYQQYGTRRATATAGAGTIVGSGASVSDLMVAATVASAGKISLSSNVRLSADVDATNSHYLIATKHKEGDRVISLDSDASGIYWGAGVAGAVLASGDVLASTAADDVSATLTAL